MNFNCAIIFFYLIAPITKEKSNMFSQQSFYNILNFFIFNEQAGQDKGAGRRA